MINQPSQPTANLIEPVALKKQINDWAKNLGFQQIGVSDTDLTDAETHLLNWLQSGFQGSLDYMSKHGNKRSQPTALVPGTIRIISVRMDYWPVPMANPATILNNPNLAYISRYALGRDYHKLMRQRLQKLADKIASTIGPFGYRAFVDSAPVLEKAIAEKAGLGWIGKHSNLLTQQTGSWYFLGELYTNLPLPIDIKSQSHCGDCQMCIDACPTQAIVAPYVVDARRCISYLTIESKTTIPIEFRQSMGNRIYGCDDCQLVCPWNRFASPTQETDFLPRHALDHPTLCELFQWTEAEFLHKLQGSAIRRIGHTSWLRNIAVALGNAPKKPQTVTLLQQRLDHPSAMLREHIRWAIDQQLAQEAQ